MSGNVPVCDYLHIHTDAVEKVLGKMPEDNTLFDLADIFKVFGDSTRIRILYILTEGETCVCDIAQILGMNLSAVSHQLKTLRQAKLIKFRREGKTVFYTLDDDHVKTILAMGLEHISEGGRKA